jgi:hypothetical protein
MNNLKIVFLHFSWLLAFGPAVAQTPCEKSAFEKISDPQVCDGIVEYSFDIVIPAANLNTVDFGNIVPVISGSGVKFKYILDPVMNGPGSGENEWQDASLKNIVVNLPKKISNLPNCGNVMIIKGKVSCIPVTPNWRISFQYYRNGAGPMEYLSISNELNPLYVNPAPLCVYAGQEIQLKAFIYFPNSMLYHWEALINDEWSMRNDNVTTNVVGQYSYKTIKNESSYRIDFYRFVATEVSTSIVHYSCPIKVYFVPIHCSFIYP